MGKVMILAGVLAACASQPPQQTAQQYFVRNAYPVMEHSCGGATSGCHAVNPTDPVQVTALAFVGLPDMDAYNVLVQNGYTGAFDDQAPLLTAHETLLPRISDPDLAIFDEWFVLERQERGL